MNHTVLVTLLLHMLALVSPQYARGRQAHDIVEATVDTVEDDAAGALEGNAKLRPVLGSYVEDAALQVYWAMRESSMTLKAVGDGGRSRGAWQLQQAAGDGNAWQQAHAWRALLRTGRERCGGAGAPAIMWGDCEVPTSEGPSSRTMARRRVERMRELLAKAMAQVVTSP